MESEGGEEPKLKGSLLANTDEALAGRRLRGDLLNRSVPPTSGKDSAEMLSQPHTIEIGAKVVQRDSGVTFEIVNINESGVVQLRAEGGNTVSLSRADLQNKLETKGSPWHW